MRFTKGKSKLIMSSDLQDAINHLPRIYMPMDLNPVFCNHKLQAILKTKMILKASTRKGLQDSDFLRLLECSLTNLYFFGMRMKKRTKSMPCSYLCDRRNFLNAEATFQKTLDYLLPERSEESVIISLKFFSDVAAWPYESFVEQILEVVLFYTGGKMILFNLLLTDIHCVMFQDVVSARHRMRILYDLLNSENWVIDKQKLLPFITRLLDFFAKSLAKSESKKPVYKYLRKGFEVCLRRIFERADNSHRLTIITTMLNWFSMVRMKTVEVLEFSLLLDRAAELYKVKSYTESITEGLFVHVLRQLVGSNNVMYSLIGCRLLQRFLDRQFNAPNLVTPMLYFEFSQVKLKIGQYDSSDKIFIRQHREKIEEYFMRAMRFHCQSPTNLNALFSVICCIVLEVPCGLTAAAAACMAMSVQDYALNGENLAATTRYWLHTIVISVMSLICWVHKAPVLYGYVTQIISRRAREAPQLNPPFRPFYNIGHQHVTWNKPTLFFEDWELRYGLWKHFQEPQPKDRRTTEQDRTNTKKRKPPSISYS